MTVKYSASKENYLKTIYHLQQGQDAVNTNALAQSLQTTAASVTDMLKKLSSQELLQYEKYYGVKLTPEGKRVALQIIRRHRLWELFLVEKLGFGWEEVHDIAEELEHVTSRKLVDRLDAFLDHPKHDPHGDPIPDSRGRLPARDQITLSDLPDHHEALLTSVGDQSAAMRELLNHNKIRIGTIIEVKKRFSFDDSMEIRINKHHQIIISANVARLLYVKYGEPHLS